MKKLFALIMIFALLPFAFADETEQETGLEEGDETLEQDQISGDQEALRINDGHGAKVRLLQLERSIKTNLEIGKLVLIELENSEADIDLLNSILDNIESLMLEVSSEIESLDGSEESEDLKDLYISLKDEARDLSKQFRDETKDYITQEIRDNLKESVKEINDGIKETYKEKMDKLIEEHNQKRLEILMEQLDLSDEELLEKIKSGELTITQAKNQFKSKLNGLNKEKRNNVFLKVKEFKARNKVNQEEAKSRFKEQRELNKEKLAEHRAEIKERLSIHREDMKERLENRREIINERKGNLQERKNNLQEGREGLKNNKQPRERFNNNLGPNDDGIPPLPGAEVIGDDGEDNTMVI